MTYKKSYSKKSNKKFSKRKNTSSYSSTAGKALAMAGTALTIARMIKGLINVEYKYVETYSNALYDTVAGPQIIPLSLIAQGDTKNNRNGNSVLCKNIDIKGLLTGGSAVTADTQYRLILFMDKNCQGSNPNVNDLLDTTNASALLAHYNTDNARSRFVILSDTTSILNHDLSGINDKREIKHYHQLSQHLKFDGTTATIADCTSGHMFYLITTDAGSGATAQLRYTFTSVLRYIDN